MKRKLDQIREEDEKQQQQQQQDIVLVFFSNFTPTSVNYCFYWTTQLAPHCRCDTK